MVHLFDTSDSVLFFLIFRMSILNNCLVFLLFLFVISLELIVDVHVHVVLFHGREFLLDTATDIVLTLLDSVQLHKNFIKFILMLGIEVDIQDIHVHLIDRLWILGLARDIGEISSIARFLEVV